MGMTALLAIGAIAVLLAVGVAAAVLLMNRTGRNDGATHGDGYDGSGPASYGD